MAIITFAQVKGGSGKTTAAMCTVAELVARGSTVAALDLDPNRPLGEFFQRVQALKHVEVAVPSSERRVTTLVRDLAKTHENVVIDLMGAATNDTQVAMALADLVIVPSQMSGTDLKCGVETWRQAAEAAEISNRMIARASNAHERGRDPSTSRELSAGAIYEGRGTCSERSFRRSRSMERNDLFRAHPTPT
jgi:chromosome partitioning protein